MQNVTEHLHGLLTRANNLIEKRRVEGVSLTPLMARVGLESLSRYACASQLVLKVLDRQLNNQGHAVPVRIYQPHAVQAELPVMVYFHGGGHMCGSLKLYDTVCRRMANETGHLLVSVDYRLSPEFPYPAGLSDCLAVVEHLEQLLEGFPARLERLVLAGDSAGGNLASTVAHGMQLQDIRSVTAMLLFYPSVDFTCSSPSYQNLNSGYLLESRNIDWYFAHYFAAGHDRRRASPLFFERPECFPSSLLVAAGQDPLVDEGQQFHQRLIQAGVRSEYHLEQDLIHAFLKMGRLIPDRLQVVYRVVDDFLSNIQTQ